jgi:hypothetical protein
LWYMNAKILQNTVFMPVFLYRIAIK